MIHIQSGTRSGYVTPVTWIRIQRFQSKPVHQRDCFKKTATCVLQFNMKTRPGSNEWIRCVAYAPVIEEGGMASDWHVVK